MSKNHPFVVVVVQRRKRLSFAHQAVMHTTARMRTSSGAQVVARRTEGDLAFVIAMSHFDGVNSASVLR